MRVGTIRTIIEGMSDDDVVACFWYDKTEANDYIFNNMVNGEQEPEIKENEWLELVAEFEGDEGIWQQTSESFNWYMEKITDKRDKGKVNDNSK